MGRSLVRHLGRRNLRTDRFGTICTILGVALGTATVNTVVVLDVNTRWAESKAWTTNPDLQVDLERTVQLRGFRSNGDPTSALDPKEETHEDYQVMRSAIRLGSLSAFVVGALIVFFTFGVVVERRKRELALLRSLGALPEQLARIFVFEAIVVGVSGAALGLVASIPMSVIAARAGITTTGRSSIGWVYHPWKVMLVVTAIGAITALLGIVKPALEVVRMDVTQTLRPRFLEIQPHELRAKGSAFTLITIPFMALVYVLMRPFFRELLPSLTFFVLEAGGVCALFLSMIVFAPELIRVIGGRVAGLLLRGNTAVELLTARRLQKMGHELAWSIGGVALVFALLLGLHVSTHSLKQEVVRWAGDAVRPYAFIYSRTGLSLRPGVLAKLPEDVVKARFSGRTRWPSSILAVDGAELVEITRATKRPRLVEIAERLGSGKIILSRMMARRFGLIEGDLLELSNRNETRRLQVVAVTDDIGYTPMIGPYRNSKTYGLIDASDFSLIEGYAAPIGASVAMIGAATDGNDDEFWRTRLASVREEHRTMVETGAELERNRITETDRDFSIFDAILFLTTLLAAIGIANNMVLSAHSRRREIALYRVLGLTDAQLRRMFMLEGGFIGLLGGGLAVMLGVPLGFAAISALKVVSAFEVELALPWSYVVWTLAASIGVSLLASLYPAARAVNTSSAESVHYE